MHDIHTMMNDRHPLCDLRAHDMLSSLINIILTWLDVELCHKT